MEGGSLFFHGHLFGRLTLVMERLINAYPSRK